MLTQNKLKAYQDTEKTGFSQRQIEGYIFTKAASKLQDCIRNWPDAPCDKETLNATLAHNKKMKEALDYNELVWRVFQDAVMAADSPLPKNIRQNILNISIFVHKHIFQFMIDPKPEKLEVLININLNIATGLNKNQPGV